MDLIEPISADRRNAGPAPNIAPRGVSTYCPPADVPYAPPRSSGIAALDILLGSTGAAPAIDARGNPPLSDL